MLTTEEVLLLHALGAKLEIAITGGREPLWLPVTNVRTHGNKKRVAVEARTPGGGLWVRTLPNNPEDVRIALGEEA